MIYDRDSVLYERYMEAMEHLQEVYDEERLACWQNKGQPPYEARFHFLPPVGEQGASVVPAERNLGSAELWDMNDETVVRKAQELVKQLGKEHMVQSWTLVADIGHTRAGGRTGAFQTLKAVRICRPEAARIFLGWPVPGGGDAVPLKEAWRPFLHARAHIHFERLDNDKNYDEMRAMLASDPALAQFLRNHMKATAPLFTWNFRE